jgi:hypothetical protein
MTSMTSAATCSATSTKKNIFSLLLPDHRRVLTTTTETTTTTTTTSSSSSNSSSGGISCDSDSIINKSYSTEDYDVLVNAGEVEGSSSSVGGPKFSSFEHYGSKVKEVLVAASVVHQG